MSHLAWRGSNKKLQEYFLESALQYLSFAMRKKIDEPMPIAFVAASYLISVVPQSLHAYAITRVADTMFLYFSFSFGKRFILYIFCCI